MTKSMLLLIGLFFAVPLGVAGAQTVNRGNQAVPGNQGLSVHALSIDPPGEVAL